MIIIINNSDFKSFMSKRNKIILLSAIVVILVLIGTNFFLYPYFPSLTYSYLIKKEIPLDPDFAKSIIKSEITQAQIDEAVSIKPGKNFYGKVLEKGKNDFILEIYNIFNPLTSKYVSIKIPVGSNDEFRRQKYISFSFSKPGELKTVKVSFNDMKKDDLVNVNVFE